MAEHANEYLTPNTRASQGRIADNLWPVLDRRRECSTAHRGMPRTALANGACERRLRTALANGACERRLRTAQAPFSISARLGLTASAHQHFSTAAAPPCQPGPF